MIIDHLDQSARYVSLVPGLKKGFDYLKQSDFSKIAPGRYEIDGDRVYAMVQKSKGRSADEALLESHRKYLDIQLVLGAGETFGWRETKSCQKPKGAFDTEKDIVFYDDAAGMHFTIKAGEFAIFFPDDAHAPNISAGDIWKVVVKVAV